MPERSNSRAGADSVLVTGGAGYIGSHTVRHLVRAGHEVVVIDNLYSGHRRSLADEVPLYIGDAGDRELAQRVMTRHGVSAVIHFAGHIVVPESVADPLKYYRNNVAASLALIESCRRTGVGRFVFSSSAAVYGIPAALPVGEDAVTVPINPYGRSKLVTEWTLRDVAAAAGADPFAFVALRYFNVAGASLDGSLGQATPDATHLVKVACEAACGKRERVEIFGTDYDTPDGTCIRDYIHV
jgi:UDP-glucose 4-epimerase